MPDIILQRFMIFNSSEGQDESREGDKLLFHWTKDSDNHRISLTEQIDDICLCDASINVSNRLNTNLSSNLEDSSVLSNETSKYSHIDDDNNHLTDEHAKSLVLTFESALIIVLEVEPLQSIWMAVKVSLTHPTNDCSSDGNQSPSSIPISDPNCIPVDAVKRVMSNIYTRFCLLNGSLQMIFEEIRTSFKNQEPNSESSLRSLIRSKTRIICEEYFGTVLPNMHLNSILSNIASLYNFIIYIDLNPLTLMKVNSFINHLVCMSAFQIKHTMVIFNEQLLWSSLNIRDTRLLYNYLVNVLIRDALQEELSKVVDKVRRIKENMPIYLTESSRPSRGTSDSAADIPQAKESSRILTKHHMTVFRSSNNMTLCLIVDEANSFDLMEKCEQILTSDMRLGVVPLAALAQSVGQNYIKASSQITASQQANTSSSQASNPSTPSWRRGSFSSSGAGNSSAASASSAVRGVIPAEQKYIFMDRLDASITWPLCMDMLNKENLITDGPSSEQQTSSSKKSRIIRYLIELEPELDQIRQISSKRVLEFLGRTSSDSWLMVTNARYRTIYSVHNVRNSGLNEAQQNAINLQSLLTSGRL